MRKRLLERLRTFFISESIIGTIRTSHVVIIALLLVPLTLSIAVTIYNTLSYDRLISNVDRTNQLNQIVRTEVTNELWDIVAGNKSFKEGEQYRIIRYINLELQEIMQTTRETRNQHILEVAGRAMRTLTRYVDRLGFQMENNAAVIENERMLDEIREVSVLVSELLLDFIVMEIESAAAESRQIKARALIIGILQAAIIFIAIFFSVLVRTSVTKRIDRAIGSLLSLSSSIAQGNLDARADLSHIEELETLTKDLNIMAYKIKTLIEENIREQHNLQKSEMKALQAQIKPHFLYNTLDSIVWLAEGNKSEEVISITRAFSDFFRISLNRGDEWVRVKEEFKHIESYLTIQKIRYRDILDYSIEYEQEMEQKIMLKLLLQPIVENALYHGIKNKRGRGTITIKGWQENGFLFFRVSDNGIGMTEAQAASVREQLTGTPAPMTGEIENRIYGLYNVAKRLELYYNRTDLLDIQSVYREGTKVTFCIPELFLENTKGVFDTEKEPSLMLEV